jgi:hypothetical protein
MSIGGIRQHSGYHEAEQYDRDLWGLVIVPGNYESQKRALAGAEKKLRLEGRTLTWGRVSKDNRIVRLKWNGPLDVTGLLRIVTTICIAQNI